MEPTDDQLAALSADPHPGPVVMLNLVRYRSGDDEGVAGREAYVRYSQGFVPLLKRCGGTILWAGDVTGVAIGDDADDNWDYAVLVRYPDRQAFVDTMTSPEYAAINPDRLAGFGRPRDPAGVRDLLQVRRLTAARRRFSRGGAARSSGRDSGTSPRRP